MTPTSSGWVSNRVEIPVAPFKMGPSAPIRKLIETEFLHFAG